MVFPFGKVQMGARGSGSVRRLFADCQTVEQECYFKTKIFSIIHTMVIRREVYDKFPWVVQSLYNRN